MNKSRTPVLVFHLITELSIGGAQNALLHFLEKMDRDRFSFLVVCFYNGDSVIAQKLRSLGVTVIDLGMIHKYHLNALVKLFLLLKQFRPVILHTWMFHANIPGRILGRLAGVPVIISSEHTMGQEGQFRRWVNRWTSGFCDQIVCVSQAVYQFALNQVGLPAHKLIVVPNGIDLEKFKDLPGKIQSRNMLGLPEESLIIGVVGRPRPVKGFHFLISAFVLLEKKVPSATLVFVGNGPDEVQLKRMAAESGVRQKIFFLDDRDDIPNVLPAFDLFVLPSLWEGMPIVILEAMAAGLPVLATQVGGVPELVVPDITGILVEPAAPEAWVGVMETLLVDPDLRHRLGKQGRERVETHFGINDSVAKTEGLYTSQLIEKGIWS